MADGEGDVQPTTTRSLRWRDAGGHWREITVEAKTRAGIEAMERAYRRAEAEYRRTHVNFTDLDTELPSHDGRWPEPVPDTHSGYHWEGPRVEFTHLLGSSRTWDGDPLQGGWCDICKQDWLGPTVYCLGCDRCGREKDIPKPTASDMKKRQPPKVATEKRTKKGKVLKGGRG